MRRIKILQLQHDYNLAPFDVSDFAEQIIKAFPRAEYEFVSAYLGKRPASGKPESQAERSVYFNVSTNALKGLRLRLLYRLWCFLRREKFDVIICHRFKPLSVIMRLAPWVGKPLCMSVVHSFSDYRQHSRRRFIHRHVNPRCHFIAVSNAVREHLLSLDCGFTENNTSNITNAIDVDKIGRLQLTREQARSELGLPQDELIIGTIGRLAQVKGHIYLIEAFSRVRERYPSAQLAIIGEGRERPVLEEAIERFGLSDQVHLLGEVNGAVKYVKAFDIWTMPSLSEGLGLALLEGMSAALPCIASNVPAMRPLLIASGGLTCQPGNVEELASALEHYLSMTPAQRKKKGQQAYQYLCENHTIETYRTRYRQLVEALYER